MPETKTNYCLKCDKNIWSKSILCKSCANKGSNNPNHGNLKKNITYSGIHTWITRTLGKPIHCSFDLDHKEVKYEWANVSGYYLRDIGDWTQLCIKCHRQYDWVKRGKTFVGKWKTTMENPNKDLKTGRFMKQL
jgi:hypothetical protein